MTGEQGAGTLPEGPVMADADEFARWCREGGVDTVVCGGADTHGIWRGKRLPLEDFLKSIGTGIAFSDVLFVLTHAEDVDEGQELVEPPGGAEFAHYFPRKELGFPDIFVVPDLSTARLFPWHEATVGVLGDYQTPSGEEVPIAPRSVLRRLVERAREAGFEPKFGLEYEFFVFRGDARTLKESAYRLDPLQVRPYTYGVFGASQVAGVLQTMRQHLARAGVWIEAYNPETGPGQFELNIRYADALRAADDSFLYKHGLREIATQQGLMVSFMAKPRKDWAGSSCHLHQSMWDPENGRNLFFDEDEGHGLSEFGRHYVGGLLATMREFAAFFLPTINSYKRPLPYSWAGSTVTWSYENRSTGLRAIAEHPEGARIEHRVPGADTNAYVVIAASLAGGLHGVEQKLEAPEPFEGDAYADPQVEHLPATLEESLDLLETSTLARELLGRDFVEHYLVMKRYEVQRFREQVTDWEVRRYIEMA